MSIFKDRHLQVKYVKDTKAPTIDDDIEATISVDYDKIGELLDQSSTTFRETIEMLATKAIIGVGVYVAVDTLRQVIIKVTPSN